LGESERKNLSQMAKDAVEVTYHKISLNRGYRPGIVLIDSAYGNNTSFLKELEERKLKYIGGIAKNRNILFKNKSGKPDF